MHEPKLHSSESAASSDAAKSASTTVPTSTTRCIARVRASPPPASPVGGDGAGAMRACWTLFTVCDAEEEEAEGASAS